MIKYHTTFTHTLGVTTLLESDKTDQPQSTQYPVAVYLIPPLDTGATEHKRNNQDEADKQ